MPTVSAWDCTACTWGNLDEEALVCVDIATSAEAWRQHGGGGSVSGGGVSAKRGGGAQRYGSSMVEAARRLLRWRQCDSATSAAARSAHLGRRMRQQKTKKINQIVVLGGSRTMILHNNQPKMCRHDGGGSYGTRYLTGK